MVNDTDVDDAMGQLSVTAVRTGGVQSSGSAGTVGSALVGAHGTLTLGSDGSYSYAVNRSEERRVGKECGQPRSECFYYKNSDGSLTDTAVLTSTIKGAGDVPVGVDEG